MTVFVSFMSFSFCLSFLLLFALSTTACAAVHRRATRLQFLHFRHLACPVETQVSTTNGTALTIRWIDANVVERRTPAKPRRDGTPRFKLWPSRRLRRDWQKMPNANAATLHDLAWSRIVRTAAAGSLDWAVVARTDDELRAFNDECGALLEELALSRHDPDEALIVRRRHSLSQFRDIDAEWTPRAYAITPGAAARLSATCGTEIRAFFTLPLDLYLDSMASERRSDRRAQSGCEIVRVRDAEFYEAKSNPRLWDLTYMQRDFVRGVAPIREVCFDAFAIHIFNERFAAELVERMEEHGDWAAEYSEDPVPTEDIHLHQINWHSRWSSILQRRVIPLLEELYDGTEFSGKSDPFVVRYITTGQYELEPHQDSSVVTSVVTLSNEFEGGGVTFPRYNCTFISKTLGLALVHPGKVTHQHHGLPITAGRRYIFVSFNK